MCIYSCYISGTHLFGPKAARSLPRSVFNELFGRALGTGYRDGFFVLLVFSG